MTINKEFVDAAIIQLKKNFKEVAILILLYWNYKQDIKIDRKDAIIAGKDKELQYERDRGYKKDSAHYEFTLFVNYRLQKALDAAEAKKQQK